MEIAQCWFNSPAHQTESSLLWSRWVLDTCDACATFVYAEMAE